MDEQRSGVESFMSVREMVIEIRSDLKQIRHELRQLAPIQEVARDHENRIRGLESSTAKWKYSIPPALLTSLGALFAALFGVRAQ